MPASCASRRREAGCSISAHRKSAGSCASDQLALKFSVTLSQRPAPMMPLFSSDPSSRCARTAAWVQPGRRRGCQNRWEQGRTAPASRTPSALVDIDSASITVPVAGAQLFSRPLVQLAGACTSTLARLCCLHRLPPVAKMSSAAQTSTFRGDAAATLAKADDMPASASSRSRQRGQQQGQQ